MIYIGIKKEVEMTIQFIYNAKSGFGNLLLDVAHKMISPKTYACNLCAITHNNFGRKEAFQQFVDELPVPLIFLHKDEHEQSTKQPVRYPLVLFLDENENIIDQISAEEINAFSSFAELKERIYKTIRKLPVML